MYYFDYASTTPCDLRVMNEMNEYNLNYFGNASSRNHKFGWDAEKGVENARKIIADFLKVNTNEIFFTSGATESVNLAIQGFVKGPSFNGKKIGTLVTEHKCTIETLRYLSRIGYNVEFFKVNSNGLIDLEYLNSHISEFSLISISYVNNETGVMQDINAISKICRDNAVFLHIDAAQAYGKIEIDARKYDLMSISGHKIYGPKGIGVLFISKHPRVRIQPLFYGGGQETNIRSGTLASPLCVGLGKATQIAKIELENDYRNAKLFQERIISEFVNDETEIKLNGSIDSKLPHIINLTIPYIEGESLMMKLSQFALSSGSACTSKTLEPSYVISAMHPDQVELAHSSLRICYGRGVTDFMIEKLICDLKSSISDLRKLSPLWSMKCNGVDLNNIKW